MRWLLWIALLSALWACSAERPSAEVEPAAAVAGWYLQRDGRAFFQACGESTPQPIEASAELKRKAQDFGLEDDSPVYAKLAVVADRDAPPGAGKVVRVDQFGSDTPVMGCAMTGVVDAEPQSDR